MAKIYFARAVDNRDRLEVTSSRQKVVDAFAGIGCEVINDFALGFKDDKELVESQLANIRRCDILVADLSIPNHPYIGSIGEVIYAHQMGKQVYVVYGEYDHLLDRPWLTYHVDAFFKTFQDVLRHISDE